MEEFKYGDKATHPQYGEVRVHNVYPDQNLVQIFPYNGLDQVMVHPVSLTKIVDPWKPVRIVWTSGVTTNTRIRQSEFVAYIKNLPIDQIASIDYGDRD